jgi:hypothetical protein
MMRTIDFVPVLETSILADNDVLFIPIQVPGCFKAGESAKLISVQVIDTDDQGQDFDLYFFNASATLGTLNAAVSISDTDAAKAVGQVVITAAANGTDMINSWLFVKTLDEGIVMTPADGSSSVWVGGVIRSGTPTYTATGFKIKLGFE